VVASLSPEHLLTFSAEFAAEVATPMLLAPTIALLLRLGMATDLAAMCSLSTQFEKLTYLNIIQGLCALLHCCPGSRGHVWTRQVIGQVLSAITRVAHYFTAHCSLGPAAFSTASIN